MAKKKDPVMGKQLEGTIKQHAGRAEDAPRFVVGIGCSAGGLEALEEFFGNMPEETGLAFVVVSHLDPDQEGRLPELLRRFTGMTVAQAEQGMKVSLNSVYVIPPNRDLSITHGRLRLL